MKIKHKISTKHVHNLNSNQTKIIFMNTDATLAIKLHHKRENKHHLVYDIKHTSNYK